MASGDTVIKALLTLNVANFLTSLNQAQRATGDTTTKLGAIGAVGSTLTNVGNTLTRNVTLPIVTLGTTAVNTAATFEQAMSKVQALSGATGSDFEALSTKAREMGANTIYSATESAEAFQYMALAGWDTNQMLAGIEPILYLAGGAMMDLGTTSDIVTDNLTAFGYSAEDTEHFTDVLAQTMRSSNTDVLQMGEAFKYVAPLAGTLGFTIEDTALAVGIMADNGIKGSQAGTALRSAISNLVNPTDKMAQVMDQYNIQVTNADGSMLSLREIMDNVRSSLGGMTEEQQQAALSAIEMAGGAEAAQQAMAGLSEEEIQLATYTAAGQEAMQDWTDEQYNAAAAATLTKDELKNMSDEQIEAAVAYDQGRQALEGLTQQEQAAASANLFGRYALSGMLAIVNSSEEDYNSLAGAIDNAEGSTQDLYKVSQDNMLGTVADLNSSWEELMITIGEKLIPVLVPLIEKLIEVIDWVANLDEGVLESIISFAGFIAAVGPVLSFIGNLLTVISSLGTAIKAIGAVVAAIGAPISIIIAIIAAVVAAVVWLWNTNEGFREAVIEIWENIKEFIGNAIDAIIIFFTETLPEGISNLIIWFQELPGKIIEAITSFPEKVAEWATGVYEAFSTWITNVIESVVEWFTALPGRIYEALVTFFTETIPTWAAETWEAFKTAVNDIVDFVIYLFSELPFKILIAIRDTVISIAQWGVETYEKAKEVVSNTIESIIEWFKALPGRIYDTIVRTIERVQEWGRNMIDKSREVIGNFIDNTIEWLTALPGRIYDTIVKTIEKIGQWGSDMITKGREVIGNFIDSAIEWFQELPERVVSVGSDIVKGIWEGIKSMGDWIAGKVWDFCSNIYDGITSFFDIGSPSKLLEKGVGKWLPPGIAVGMEDNLDTLKPATESVGRELEIGLDKNIGDAMSTITQSMQSAMTALAGATVGFGSSLLTATDNLGDEVRSPIAAPVTEPAINIGEIIVRNEDDLTALSRGLFNRDVGTLRALGRI